MKIGKYRKKPIVIEAMQWDGKTETGEAIIAWTNKAAGWDCHWDDISMRELTVDTLEGTVEVSHGSWIIKGIQGEFYPCRDDIFRATYDDETEVPHG